MPYDPRYLEGIAHFNACDFFEAHEIWEAVWTDDQSPSRRFYQGLIQAAVCLHHFGNGNLHGARKLYFSCRRYLDEFQPHHLGLNLTQFLAQLEMCCRELVASEHPESTVVIDADQIPEIHLQLPPEGAR